MFWMNWSNPNDSLHEIRRGIIEPRMEIVQDDHDIGLKLALPERSVLTTFQVKVHKKSSYKFS